MTDKNNSSSTMNYTYSDRAIDDDPSPWDISLPSSRDTIDLLGYWNRMQGEKKKLHRDTPEWKMLEKSYLTHLRWRFDYPRKIAAQQIVFTWIMTFLVFTLVIAGLIFSFMQLTYAISVGDLSQIKSEIVLKVAGELSFRSSLVGATVLVISLIFYYLYLHYIFSAKQNKPLHLSLFSTDAPRLFGRGKYVPRRRRTDKKSNDG